jgi:hypothetical protein
VRLEGLGQLKKFNDLIGNRTRDLLPRSIAPQPSTLPRFHFVLFLHKQSPLNTGARICFRVLNHAEVLFYGSRSTSFLKIAEPDDKGRKYRDISPISKSLRI